MTQPTIPERFAARRAELLALRKSEYPKIDSMDFAPRDGICKHRNIHKANEPRCGFDLVAFYAEDYPTAPITGCPECGSSFCD